jgi:hypothetical protein
MTINTVAAAKALNRIERHPETWNQATWCGCFAAQVVRAEGHRIEDDKGRVFTAGGENIGYVWHVASEILFGNPDYFQCSEARILFLSCNTLARIKELVAEHIARAVEEEYLSYHHLDDFLKETAGIG